MTFPRPPRALDARVSYLLGRAAAVAGRRANAALADLGLDTRHYAVLAAVEDADGPSQRAIAESLGIDRATVVALTDHLEEQHLLQRTRSTTDRRAYHLTLTAAGRRLLVGAHARMDACDRELLAGLGDQERSDLGLVLRQVLSDQARVAEE